VDLSIHYLDPSPTARTGGKIRLGLPYDNSGTDTAANVVLTIDPPARVTLTAADILADASGADDPAGPPADETDAATCEPADAGDANTVSCTGPAVPVGATSQLWMTLYVAQGVASGTYPVTVQISTTSPEGDVSDNFAVAQMTVSGEDDAAPGPVTTPNPAPVPTTPNDNSPNGPDLGDNLPRTGQNIVGLMLLSAMLVLGGVAARIVARKPNAIRPRRAG
jgi:hypothetical protein